MGFSLNKLLVEKGKKNLGWNRSSSSSKPWVIDEGAADYINSARLRDQRLNRSLQEERVYQIPYGRSSLVSVLVVLGSALVIQYSCNSAYGVLTPVDYKALCLAGVPASCCELESPTRRLTFRYPSVLIPQSPNVSSSMNVAPVLRNVSSVSRSLEVHASLLGMEEATGIVLHPLFFS
ncbi:hypothetical protein NE237_008247 [Protea cynaroides]|uniref:Uncharacterized protein n=1 Tax=Protea cynaroides TaxID=273540 RepID=A0A9Q0JSI1_9MAGN|nr:hypothetical protein NE237_000096 [Protea cynaroides]KAJ4949907.1 hypothetical protein NE237_008247 [Protea cynaroides]